MCNNHIGQVPSRQHSYSNNGSIRLVFDILCIHSKSPRLSACPSPLFFQVAEVRSRFEGEEGGVERFLEVTKRLGFDCRQMDRSNKMFLMAEFKKSARTPEKGVEFEAKVRNSREETPCRAWYHTCLAIALRYRVAREREHLIERSDQCASLLGMGLMRLEDLFGAVERTFVPRLVTSYESMHSSSTPITQSFIGGFCIRAPSQRPARPLVESLSPIPAPPLPSTADSFPQACIYKRR